MRLSAYAGILQGVKGLFHATGDVTRGEFKAYVDTLEIDKFHPGIQGVGFSVLIKAADKERHLAAVRSEGFSDYRIRPEGDRQVYSSIIYLEPFKDRNLRAFGYDMYAEPTRHAAMHRARLNNEIALSAKVKLVQETEQDVQPGFLMYNPLYENGTDLSDAKTRAEHLRGWVYSPFRMRDFMQGLLFEENSAIGFEIFDQGVMTEENLLYRSSVNEFENYPSFYRTTRLINFGGHSWLLSFHSHSQFEAVNREQMLLIAGLGSIISLALSSIVGLLVRGRIRAQVLAEKMTQRFKEAEAHYHEFFSENSSAIAIINPGDGCFVEVNAAAAKFWGYSAEQISQMKLGDIDTRPAHELKSVFESTIKSSQIIEANHRLNSGQLRNVEIYFGRLHQREKTLIYGIIHDITERELVKKALQENEQRFRTLFEYAPVAYQCLDREGRYLDMNQQLCDLLGYRREELLGLGFEELWPDNIKTSFCGTMFQVQLKENPRIGTELQLIRKDGLQITVLIEGHAQVDSRNEFSKVHCILTNISERKKMEDKLYENLLALRAAENRANLANQAKSDFIANMSHEIRTPMNAIIGLMHLILKTELSDKQREYLKKMQASSYYLLNIINDILDFSKIEAGKLIIEQTEFNLEHLLEHLSSLIREKAVLKGVELIFDLSPDVPIMLCGDALRIEQILTNLSANAVKFTQHGQVRVSIHNQRETEHEVQLRFSVTDSGIGLKPEQIGKLFQAFEQADNSTTRKYGGTGLGLAICKRLVKLMGGEIGVNSEFGQGSEFWFTLGLLKSKAAQPEFEPQIELQGKRILVIDDNREARLVLIQMLNAMTFKVDGADCGQAGIEATIQAAQAGQPYEMIFVDWRMPDLPGDAVIYAIRSSGISPQPVLSLITAFEPGDTLIKKLEEDIGQVLLKPFTISTLLHFVMNRLKAETGTLKAALPVDVDRAGQGIAEIAGAEILLVEDNEMNQQIATELLSDAGFIVDLAVHGAQAIEKVQQKNYALVLMDVQMPVMDGITATREIRKLAGFTDLPIIAMTANAMQQDRDECLAAGMNGHIGKPIELDNLWAVLRQWIKPGEIKMQVTPNKAQPVDEGEIELPTEIEGLDTGLGLQRMGGKRKLYRFMLNEFILKQAEAIEKIQAALATGDRISAERIAHTLKGLAGNIGAVSLQKQAAVLETALHTNETAPQLNDILTITAQQLAGLISALQIQLQPVPQNVEGIATEIDVIKLHKVVLHLATLLRDSDAEAYDYLSEHENLLQTAFSAQFSALHQAIINYDFASALNILRQAAETKQITW